MPEPWASLLAALMGPYGVIAALGAVFFFLWRLFREEQKENRKSLTTVATLTQTVKDLATEVRAWREAVR